MSCILMIALSVLTIAAYLLGSCHGYGIAVTHSRAAIAGKARSQNGQGQAAPVQGAGR